MHTPISRAYAHVTNKHVNPSLPAAPSAVETPENTSSSAISAGGMDSFAHTEPLPLETEYAGTMYARNGQPEGASGRVLPDRYYEQLSAPKIGYKGTMVSYAELLEEAVTSGAVVLDEEKSVWDNLQCAENALIWDKAKPLYPWSGSLYTEDGQYKLRIEGGQVTGSRLAWYLDDKGRKITVRQLAEQLAGGALPTELDGDYRFLHDIDPDLYFRCLEIGSAKRQAENAIDQFEQGRISQQQLDDDLGPLVLLLFGKSGSRLSLRQLKEIFADSQSGAHILQTLGTSDFLLPDQPETAG